MPYKIHEIKSGPLGLIVVAEFTDLHMTATEIFDSGATKQQILDKLDAIEAEHRALILKSNELPLKMSEEIKNLAGFEKK